MARQDRHRAGGALGERAAKKEQMDYFQRDHAWFAAFAPADDPEIAVVVLNEHAGHGSAEAAPTAAAVMQKYFDLKAEDEAARTGVASAPAPAAAPAVTPADPPRHGARQDAPAGAARGA